MNINCSIYFYHSFSERPFTFYKIHLISPKSGVFHLMNLSIVQKYEILQAFKGNIGQYGNLAGKREQRHLRMQKRER